MATQDLIARSATTTPMPSVRDTMEVAKLIDTSKCIGCKACQVACSEWNDIRDEVGETHGVYDNPMDLTAESWTLMRFAEYENADSGSLEWLIRKDGCMHCAEPGCLKACPSPGAIVQYANGIVDFNQDHCIGCGYCITGCPFNIPRISAKDKKAYQCTLCSDRVSLGLQPVCVKTCPTGAIVLRSKADMKQDAACRLPALAQRGLPEDPIISPAVSLWKGITRPLAMLAMGAAVLGGFFHYVGIGPNRVEEDYEPEAGDPPPPTGEPVVHQVDPGVHQVDPRDPRSGGTPR